MSASLRLHAINGLIWSLAEKWSARLTSFAVFLVLARLLTAADFGLVALASVYVQLLTILQEQGLGHALVQRASLNQQQQATAFWVSLALAAILAGLTFVSAPPIADITDQPQLASVLRVLSLAFFPTALCAVPEALLLRRMDFKRLALRSSLSVAIAGASAVVLAIVGAGVWAMVAQSIVQTTVAALVLWTAVDWRPSVAPTWRAYRDLITFGANIIIMRLSDFASRRSDDVLIGTMLGPVPLGLYTVAYRILLVITDLFTGAVGNVALPIFSRIQDERERLCEALYSSTRVAVGMAVPAFLGISALSPIVIPLVFGRQWNAAVPVMQILGFIGIVHSIGYISTSALIAVGRSRDAMLANIANAILNVIVFVIVVRWGITAVALGYVIRGYVMAPLPLILLRRDLPLHFRTYFANLFRLLFAGLVMFLALTWLVTELAGEAIPDVAQLGIALSAGIVVYVAIVAIIDRLLLRDVIHIVKGIGHRRQVAA